MMASLGNLRRSEKSGESEKSGNAQFSGHMKTGWRRTGIFYLLLQYKNYIIEDQPTSESSYRLSVGLIEDNEIKYKHIYSCFYNNVRDRISWENKYDDNFSIEGTFFVCIDVNAMVIPDYDSNDEVEVEVEDIKPTRKTMLEPECIICYENKSNMLYLDCLHVCVCDVCDSKGKFKKCPLCRTKIKNQKIRLT